MLTKNGKKGNYFDIRSIIFFSIYPKQLIPFYFVSK